MKFIQNSRARFTLIFDIAQDCHTPTISRPTINDLNTSSLAQIAQLVATNCQLFNIIDVTQWAGEHPEIPVDDELKQTQAVLCMPIINAQKSVIGVVQFIDKVCTVILSFLQIYLYYVMFIYICHFTL